MIGHAIFGLIAGWPKVGLKKKRILINANLIGEIARS